VLAGKDGGSVSLTMVRPWTLAMAASLPGLRPRLRVKGAAKNQGLHGVCGGGIGGGGGAMVEGDAWGAAPGLYVNTISGLASGDWEERLPRTHLGLPWVWKGLWWLARRTRLRSRALGYLRAAALVLCMAIK